MNGFLKGSKRRLNEDLSFGQETKKVKDAEAAGPKTFKRYLDTCGGYDFTNLIPLLFGNFRWTKEDLGK